MSADNKHNLGDLGDEFELSHDEFVVLLKIIRERMKIDSELLAEHFPPKMGDCPQDAEDAAYFAYFKAKSALG